MSKNNLYKLFIHAVENFTNNKAITFSGDTVTELTYFELCSRVQHLRLKFEEIFFHNEVIGIYSRECLNLPVILLAVLGASAAFFPISLTLQQKNLVNNVDICSIRYILIQSDLTEQMCLKCEGNAEKTNMERIQCELLKEIGYSLLKVTSTSPYINNDVQDLAYVMQTSGTTGLSKKVYVPHSCIVPNIIHLSTIFEISSRDVVFISSPYTFDPFVVQMFLALSKGAELLMVPQAFKLIPNKLCQKIFEEQHVTVFQPTPSLMYFIGEDLIMSKILSEETTLSVLAFGGEICPSLSTLRKWKNKKCPTRLYNVYGITEVSSWATCHLITDEELDTAAFDVDCEVSNTCELGKPLLHTKICIRNDNGEEITSGFGHLFIGGEKRRCLLEGESGKDAPVMRCSGDEVRVNNGRIWYLGRSDNQIKRFGQRINLDHIEITVRNCNEVSSCACVVENLSNCANGLLLHMFVVPKLLSSIAAESYTTLRERINDCLPRASVPDRIHLIQQLPLTNHEKVDKHKLLIIAKQNWTSCNTSKLSVDVAISHMWSDCLMKSFKPPELNNSRSGFFDEWLIFQKGKVNAVKTNEMFMLQGGDSFRAVQLVGQIEKWIETRTGYPIQLPHLLNIIVNKPFHCVISYVMETLKEFKNRTMICESDCHKKIIVSNYDADSGNDANSFQSPIRDVSSLFSPAYSMVRDICACYFKRGAQRQTCLACADSNACLLFYKNDKYIKDSDLRLKWEVCMEKCIDASPLVVTSCFKGKSTVFIGSHSHLFMSVSLSTGNLLWKNRLGGRIESSACLSRCGRYIIVGCYDGKVYVLIKTTGAVWWVYQTQDIVKSSPCLDQDTGLIWIGCHDGHLYALDVDLRVCQLIVNCVNGSCFSSAVVSYDPHCVYIGTLAGYFLCIDAQIGKTKWLKQLEKPIFSTALVQGNTVVVTLVNGLVKRLSYSGDEIWELQTTDSVFSSPVSLASSAMSSKDLIIASHGHKVHCISFDGHVKWTTKVNGPVYATPSSINSRSKAANSCKLFVDSACLVVATTKGTVYILAETDGSILRTFSLPGEVFSSPVIVGQDVVVGCRNNFLYCITISQ